MAEEYTPQAPALNTHLGSKAGPLVPLDDGGTDRVFLNRMTLGWSPELYPVILIQAVANATVDVLGIDEVTWCPYPGSSAAIAAGAIKVVRGRWKALRVNTAGNIWVKGDLNPDAYNGVL